MAHEIWTHLFACNLPLIEKILRPVIIYFFLVLGLRFAGKRELAALNPFDFVVLMTLSNTVQNGIIGDDNSVTGAMVGAGSLLLINYVTVRVLFGHQSLERLVEGDADVLLENGRVREDRLKKELITLAELEAAAHKQGFGSLDEVDRAVLEAGGTICFFAKKPDPVETQFTALRERLDAIAATLAELRASSAQRKPA